VRSRSTPSASSSATRSLLAVDDLTLSVAQCDVYGILGPNGAGKTTFLRMLFGLIRPDKGAISLFGQSVEENTVAALRRSRRRSELNLHRRFGRCR